MVGRVTFTTFRGRARRPTVCKSFSPASARATRHCAGLSAPFCANALPVTVALAFIGKLRQNECAFLHPIFALLLEVNNSTPETPDDPNKHEQERYPSRMRVRAQTMTISRQIVSGNNEL
jgi:hypothetical protein